MKVLFINSVCGIRSTGRICDNLAREYELEGHEVKIAYGRELVPDSCKKYAVRIGSNGSVYLHAIASRIFDNSGFGSKRSTYKFLEWADEYNPDLLWLHNLHGYYINIEELFNWIKSRPNMKVKWTLHDCWAFTGHCCYFTLASCDKWKTQCEKCPQKRLYPTSYVCDSSRRNYICKRELFTGVKDMEIITPSEWLANLVRKSFLKDYPVRVVYNNIDRDVFKPTESDFRDLYDIGSKIMILGVASTWSERKGLKDFIKINSVLSEDYVIVLVGLNDKQMKDLPKGIIGIKSTNSPKELAEIYTAADYFFNPTYEDNYPTVNLESEACGTPVITYDIGGCRETVAMNNSYVIDVGDISRLVELI